VKELT